MYEFSTNALKVSVDFDLYLRLSHGNKKIDFQMSRRVSTEYALRA